jgi:hypothetical protein
MRRPVVSDPVQYFEGCGSEPIAAIVTHHNYGHWFDLHLFPKRGHFQIDPDDLDVFHVPFIPEGAHPPHRDSYFRFAPEDKAKVSIPANVSIT